MPIKDPEVVVITGASASVGRAAVLRQLGKDGARIGLIARDREHLERVKQEVTEAGTPLLCSAG